MHVVRVKWLIILTYFSAYVDIFWLTIEMAVSGKRIIIAKEETVEELKKMCDLCDADNVTNKAKGICRECEEFMCNTCFRHHLKAKSCRHHVLIDINKSLTAIQRSAGNVEKCKMHANETIKFYCRKHQTVGCGECMIPGHTDCKPENIKDLSKDFEQNEDFKSIMAKIEDLMFANSTIDKKMQESKKKNKRMLEEALKTIQNLRSKINKYLDKAEGIIINEVKEIERINDNFLIKLEQYCGLLSSEITEIRQKLDTGLYKGSLLFIQCVKCKPKIMDIERTCTKIQGEDEFITFRFVPDEQLQRVFTSIEKLGQVDRFKSSAKSETTPLIKQRHSNNATNAKASTEEVTEREKSMRNARNREIEEKQKGRPAASYIDVGSRVRPAPKRGWHHRGEPGTVTAVHPDGRVDVKWDATGFALSGYTVGEHGYLELV